MRPFRAPRSTDGKTAAKASPTRQSPRRQGKEDSAQDNTDDSEGPTELHVTRWVIKETEDSVQDNTDKNSEGLTDCDDVDANGQTWTIESRKKRAEVLVVDAPSPSLSEFEAYLDKEVVGQQQEKEKAPTRKMQSKNDFWERNLESEKKRIEALQNDTLVPLEDIMVWNDCESTNVESGKLATLAEDISIEECSSDDDVPIVSTLKSANTSVKVTKKKAATTTVKITKKKAPLWTYETVNEPTGVASNYWDAEAPSERATKRLAKIKLSLGNAEATSG